MPFIDTGHLYIPDTPFLSVANAWRGIGPGGSDGKLLYEMEDTYIWGSQYIITEADNPFYSLKPRTQDLPELKPSTDTYGGKGSWVDQSGKVRLIRSWRGAWEWRIESSDWTNGEYYSFRWNSDTATASPVNFDIPKSDVTFDVDWARWEGTSSSFWADMFQTYSPASTYSDSPVSGNITVAHKAKADALIFELGRIV